MSTDTTTTRLTWYFTFAAGTDRGHKYVSVAAESSLVARQAMVERYGRVWAFQYDSKDCAGCERWGLTLLEHIEAIDG